jgi:uncharacterized FlaG/YvyC family protein
MSDTTSIRWTKENREYVDEMIDNVNGYINDLVARERRTASLTRREKLERELAEVREERARKEKSLDDLELTESELKNKLENHTENVEARIDSIVDGLGIVTIVHPRLRGDKEWMTMVRNKTGVKHSVLVDLCESVDIHCHDVPLKQIEHFDEQGVSWEDLCNHPLYDDEKGRELTEAEEDEVREWLQTELN